MNHNIKIEISAFLNDNIFISQVLATIEKTLMINNYHNIPTVLSLIKLFVLL